jgi:hypothetical protein
MNLFPYEITYSLPHAPNRRSKRRIDACHMGEAKKQFHNMMPAARILYAKPLPSNV